MLSLKGQAADALTSREVHTGEAWRNRPGQIHAVEALEDCDLLECCLVPQRSWSHWIGLHGEARTCAAIRAGWTPGRPRAVHERARPGWSAYALPKVPELVPAHA